MLLTSNYRETSLIAVLRLSERQYRLAKPSLVVEMYVAAVPVQHIRLLIDLDVWKAL